MQIARALFNQMVALFAANTAVLGVEDPNQIRSQGVNVPFTPGLDRVLADVPKQAAGLAAVPVLDGGEPIIVTDPVDGSRVVTFSDNGDGYVMRSSSTTFPFTIYGVRLVDQDDTILYATETFDAPVIVTADVQGFDIPKIRFRFPPEMVR